MYCFPLSSLISLTGKRAALQSLFSLDQIRNSTWSPILKGWHWLQFASHLSPCKRPPLPQLCELHSGVPMNLVWKSFRKLFGKCQTDLFRSVICFLSVSFSLSEAICQIQLTLANNFGYNKYISYTTNITK